jgi:hypothetical protein
MIVVESSAVANDAREAVAVAEEREQLWVNDDGHGVHMLDRD